MKSVEYDLRYFTAGLENLEQYLLSDDIFWPLGINPPDNEPDYPNLTLGWLLVTQARLSGRKLSSIDKDKFEKADSELDSYRSKWRVAWEKKANQCYQVRGRMWRDFLEEYQDNPQEHSDRYSYEVRLRAMMELLKADISQQAEAEVKFLSGLDGYLKSVLQPGDFIWEQEVQPGFPKDEFWFLYGTLPKRLKKS